MTAIIIEHPNAAIGRQRMRRRDRAILCALSNARFVMAAQADFTPQVVTDAITVLHHFGTAKEQATATHHWNQLMQNGARVLQVAP